MKRPGISSFPQIVKRGDRIQRRGLFADSVEFRVDLFGSQRAFLPSEYDEGLSPILELD